MPNAPLQFDLFAAAQPGQAATHPRNSQDRQPHTSIDASNPTGYAQTIEEFTDGVATKTYTLGLDVISQAINDSGATGTLRTLLYDGHGSVRQLVDSVGTVVKAALDAIGGPEVLKLDYTAYGQAINFAAASAVSSLLHSGEFTDASTGQQYLRARFYNPATGRFNRVDPFAGAFSEPQSLHKYLYGHGDPITNADPSGEFILVALGVIAAISTISLLVTLGISLFNIGQSAGNILALNDFSNQIRNSDLSLEVQLEVRKYIYALFRQNLANIGSSSLDVANLAIGALAGSVITYATLAPASLVIHQMGTAVTRLSSAKLTRTATIAKAIARMPANRIDPSTFTIRSRATSGMVKAMGGVSNGRARTMISSVLRDGKKFIERKPTQNTGLPPDDGRITVYLGGGRGQQAKEISGA